MLDRISGHGAISNAARGPPAMVALSRQVHRWRLETDIAHTIATIQASDEVCPAKIWCIPREISDAEAVLPRFDRRKISIDLFHLTGHEFGSAMPASFQVFDNKKA